MDLEVVIGAKQVIERAKGLAVADPWTDPAVLFGHQIEVATRRLLGEDRLRLSVGYRDAGIRVVVDEGARQALMDVIASKLRNMEPRVSSFYTDVLQVLEVGLRYQ